jgi:tetratricopeptide (TPR) repeat protein
MTRFVFALAAAAALLSATPAHAQSGWGMSGAARHPQAMGIIEYQSRDWAQCAGEEVIAPQRAISACGRIIGERVSRDITATAYFYRSELYRQIGDAQRADADVGRSVSLLTELTQVEPDNPDYASNLAYLRGQMHDYAGGAADFTRLVALRPQAIEHRIRQADFLFRAQDFISAASAFDAAAELDPTNAAVQAGRCEARAAANREIEMAAAACAEALRLTNDSSLALFSRGYFNFMQGRIEDALADFRAAGEKDNTNPYAAYGYGVSSVRLGREERGRALIAQVTEAVPDVEAYANAGLRP